MTEEVDVQPTGVSIERTMDVIPNILTDPEFAEEVRAHNGWPEGLDQKDIAILFLTGRFQSAVDLLVRRTDTLRRIWDSTSSDLAAVMDRQFEEE